MLGGISIWQIAIILVIVILIFGTKKLKNLGSDLGGAVKGFKKAMNEGEEGTPPSTKNTTEEKAIDQASTADQSQTASKESVSDKKS